MNLDHWWCIQGHSLMYALKRVRDGDDPDVVYLELLANSDIEDYRKGDDE